MRVLPDTPIWSAVLRRQDGSASLYRSVMLKLLGEGIVEIIGPIRQELLSGIKETSAFETLRNRLHVFQDLEIETADFEEAASCYNRCRSKGIQGSSADFLICAVAIKHDLAIFTDDQDFLAYKRILPIRLYSIEKNS